MDELWMIVAARLLAVVRPARLLDVGGPDLEFAHLAAASLAGWGGTVVAVRAHELPLSAQADNIELLTPCDAQTLAAAGPAQLTVLHGDANWWTVTSHLRALAGAADQAAVTAGPIVVAATGAPWGRRDHYEDQESVPADQRQPSEPAEDGWAALDDGTPRNGVLTAVEDFVRDDARFELVTLPGLGGASVLTTLAEPNAPAGELALSPIARAALDAVDGARDPSRRNAREAAERAHEIGLRDAELVALRARIDELTDAAASARVRADRAEQQLRALRPAANSARGGSHTDPGEGGAGRAQTAAEPSAALVRSLLEPQQLLAGLGWAGPDRELSLPIPADLGGLVDRHAEHSLIVGAGDDPLALRRTLCSVIDRAREPVAVTVAIPTAASEPIRKLVAMLRSAIGQLDVCEERRLTVRPGAQQLLAGQELAPGWPGPRPGLDGVAVAYLLPGMPAQGSGGANSVVQEARGLRQLGTATRVCIPRDHLARAEQLYGNADDLFVVYEHDTEVAWAVGGATLAVACEHTSVPLLVRLARERPKLALAYYIQDYETLFARMGSARSDRALLSYGELPDATLFAKSHFLRNVIGALHGLPVVKVAPSLDRAIFHADGRDVQSDVLTVTAMVRPLTPRRRPRATVEALSIVGSELGDQVRLMTFGCEHEELAEVAGGKPPRLEHLGPLSREAVAEQLRTSDVFLDASAYQAFGRGGFEAMACGAVPILPALGGAHEFAVDDGNAILFDDDRAAGLAERVLALAGDRDRLLRLRSAGIATAARYSVAGAARSQQLLFSTLCQTPAGAG